MIFFYIPFKECVIYILLHGFEYELCSLEIQFSLWSNAQPDRDLRVIREKTSKSYFGLPEFFDPYKIRTHLIILRCFESRMLRDQGKHYLSHFTSWWLKYNFHFSQAGKKKVYMLYNLDPDSTVTGGAWYSDQDFESEFVDILNQQCYKFLLQKVCVLCVWLNRKTKAYFIYFNY